jgi:2'-5' RNA ligase
MKYFVGYLISGEAAEWHINLAKSISEKFGTWKIYEKLPPHVTIFYLSELEDLTPVRELLQNWTKEKTTPGNLVISDFDRFDDRVVFAKVEPDNEARDMAEELIRKLKEIPGMTQEDFPVWHPHATLAYKLTPPEINQIWEYVQTIPKPNFSIPFDNVTIFRFEGDMKWVAEESFNLSS